jgi:hypothetical protein
VVIGSNNWLFQCNVCLGDPLKDRVDRNARAFIQERQFVEALGVRFIMLIGPEKEMVYRERVPAWDRPPEESPTVAEFRAAAAGSNMDIVYPLRELAAAKSKFNVHYKYDAHWTPAGAMIGAKRLINYLHQHDPRVAAFDDAEFEIVDPRVLRFRDFDGGKFDLLVKLGVPFLRDRYDDVVRKNGWTTTRSNPVGQDVFEKSEPHRPTIVIYGDSYSESDGFRRTLAEYFGKTTFVTDGFPSEILRTEKPDYFVVLRFEHSIGYGDPPRAPE